MRNLKFFVLILSFVTLSCQAQKPTTFSEEALNDTFITLEGESITFAQILENHKGKTILIDVWASWCKDCLKGMPKVKALQISNPDVEYVFLSLDKSIEKWKKGIEKYMQSGWKGAFGEFLDLDWIPRYLVVDENGNITNFKEVKVNNNLKNNLP